MSGSMRTCTKCEKVFRVASHKIRKYQCDECLPRYTGNRYAQQKRREKKMTNEGYRRLRTIEEKLEALEITMGVHQAEVNTIAGDIVNIATPLVEEAVESKVEKMVNEKIADVKELEHNFGKKLATVNKRVREVSDGLFGGNTTLGELTKTISELSKKVSDLETKLMLAVEYPLPHNVPAKEDMKVLNPLTKLQKKRLNRLIEYMGYHGRAMTRREALIGVWHDVPKSAVTELFRLGIEHDLIELDKKAMNDYYKESGGKTPDHGGPGNKLRFYRIKSKDTGPGSLKNINIPFPFPSHTNMNPKAPK